MAVKDRVGDCEAALITPEEAMLHQRIFREKKWKRVKYHKAGCWVFSKQKKKFFFTVHRTTKCLLEYKS